MDLKTIALEEEGVAIATDEVITLEEFLTVEEELNAYSVALDDVIKYESKLQALETAGDYSISTENYVDQVAATFDLTFEGAIGLKLKNLLAWFKKVYDIVVAKFKETMFRFTIGMTNYISGSYGKFDKLREVLTDAGLSNDDKLLVATERLSSNLPSIKDEEFTAISYVLTYRNSNSKSVIDNRFDCVFTALRDLIEGNALKSSLFKSVNDLDVDKADGVSLNLHVKKPTQLFVTTSKGNVSGVAIKPIIFKPAKFKEASVTTGEVVATLELIDNALKQLGKDTKGLHKSVIAEYDKLKKVLEDKKPTSDVELAKWQIDSKTITGTGIKALLASFKANGDYMKNLIGLRNMIGLTATDFAKKKKVVKKDK